MKEVESKSQVVKEIAKAQQIANKQKLIGNLRLRKGHALYKLNFKNGVISKVDLDDPKTVSFDGVKERRKVTMEEGYLYQTALNDKNAKRKFEKMVDKIIDREKTNSSSI